ncbi:MAG: hypothetical protein GXP25_25400 [Planctomycetes bacterium]|nr:hypothetical protein [Planctomycetota bacterium]
MTRRTLIAAALAACLTAWGADAPGIVLTLDVTSRGVEVTDYVAQVDVDLGEVEEVLGVNKRAVTEDRGRSFRGGKSLNPDLIGVMEIGPGGKSLGETVSQFDVVENARGTLLWLVKGKLVPKQTRRFAVFVKKVRVPAKASGLKVSDSGTTVTVENEHFKVVHPKKENGGLPKTITFKKSGKTDSTLTFNDRLYDKNTKTGYSLRNDTKPKVRIAHSGPLRTVIETEARYVTAEGESNDAQPSAVYRFSYMAGSPTVGVEAAIRQEAPFTWSELHFLELYHKPSFFPKWVLGPDGESGVFTTTFDPKKEKDRKKSFSGGQWGALFGNGAALGLAVPGRLLIYDGAGDYGTYLHGPWVHAWSGPTWQARAHLYLGADTGAPGAIRQWAERIAAEPSVRMNIPGMDEEVRSAERRTESPMAKWRLARAAADIRSGRNIAKAARTIREIARQKEGFSLFRPKVEVHQAEGRTFVANGRIGLGFGRTDAGTELISIYDFKRKRDLLPKGTAGTLWRVVMKNAKGDSLTLTNRDVLAPPQVTIQSQMFDDSRTVELRWEAVSLPDGQGIISVTMKATVPSNSPLTRWRINVENEMGDFGLWTVEFPIISGIDGRTAADPKEFVVYPQGWGVLDPTPRATLRYRPMYPSGSCAMQCMAYTSGGSGLYCGAHDGGARTKTMNAQGTDPTSGITFSWIQYPEDMMKPGVSYRQPYDVIVGVFSGDWYDAARIYRRWALKQQWASRGPVYKRKDIPDLFKTLAMWGRTRPNPKDAKVDNRRFKERFRVNMANHWYCWHVIPFDNDYPNYFPAKPGFKEAVAEAQKLPVWQMPYINGRLWDTDTENFKKIGYKFCTRNEKMEPYIEVYGSKQKLAPMCVHTQCWQDKVNEIVWKLIDEYGLNGVYIDQVGAAAPRLCMDPSHGHPLGGGKWWVEGYWKMLSRMKKRMKTKHPDTFLTTESNAEPYMEYFDGYLMCNSTRDHLVPFYSAVYHDYNLTFGRYVFARDLKKENTYYMKMGQLFAFGAQLAWMPSDILNPEYKAGADYLAHLAKLRQNSLKYLAYGEMLRPLKFTNDIPIAKGEWTRWRRKITVEMPAIQSSVWRAPDGTVGIAFTNVLKSEIPASYVFNTLAYGLPEAKEYILSEITEQGEKEIGRVQGPRISRTETIPGHKARIICVKSAGREGK